MGLERLIRTEPFADEDAALADARARAELEAGRGVPHEDVRRWVDTLGTSDAFPMPDEWRG